ncbi:hypothetical protein PV326_012088 [Microctonus aethiopoides]|nr:hypothetical protein PV326_012088 [Microctonus aethiopoides]
MVSSFFKEWFHSEFVSKVALYVASMKPSIKDVLLVDHCSSHALELKMENIKVVFSPHKTTALTQPMDQEISQCSKLKYRLHRME